MLACHCIGEGARFVPHSATDKKRNNAQKGAQQAYEVKFGQLLNYFFY